MTKMRINILALAALMVFACAEVTPDTPTPTPGGDPDPVVKPVADTTKLIDESFGIYLGKGAAFGSEGRICVYNRSDDRLIDYVDFADLATVELREDGQLVPKEQITGTTVKNTMMDAIYSGSNKRVIHCTPVRIEGDSLLFKPHFGKIGYDKEYYITADASIVTGVDFKGIEKGQMCFRTCKQKTSSSEIVVAKTGKADFRTVQAAIDRASEQNGKARTIIIGDGVYRELLYIRDNSKLTLKAASGASPEISYANYDGWMGGTSYRPVILVENCDLLTFDGLILRNAFGSTAGQAEVIYNNDNTGKGRLIIKRCELWSYQDTFLTKGYAWIYKSLIAGHCDYIWGYPKTCLFEGCEIRSLAKGYIVQCRCTSASDKGFVFLRCELTAGDGLAASSMTLARSGGKATEYDNVSYINCAMSPVITSAGWHTSPSPNPSTATATSGWKEYGSSDLDGKTISLSGRASCAKILTEEEAAAYSTRSAVFADAPFTDADWLNP